MDLILVRHGETVWDAEHRWQGNKLGGKLTDLGISQAHSIAELLEKIPIDKIFSSPLARAFDTAKIINKKLNLDLSTDDLLKEVDVGILHGLTPQEVEEKYPGMLREREWDMLNFKGHGGENFKELIARVNTFLSKIDLGSNSGKILIVAHAGALRAMLASIFSLQNSEYMTVRIPHNCVHFVNFSSRKPFVVHTHIGWNKCKLGLYHPE